MRLRPIKRTRQQVRDDVRQWLADYVERELTDGQIDELLEVVRSGFGARAILGERERLP